MKKDTPKNKNDMLLDKLEAIQSCLQHAIDRLVWQKQKVKEDA